MHDNFVNNYMLSGNDTQFILHYLREKIKFQLQNPLYDPRENNFVAKPLV